MMRNIFSKMTIGLGFFGLLVFSFLVYAREPELTDVRIRFCNDTTLTGGTKDLNMEIDPMIDYPLCVYLANRNPDPVQVKLNFVDGIITNDSHKEKACKNEDQKQNFGRYVNLGTGKDSIFTLSGMSVVKKEFTLRYPDGIAGKIYGCATLSLVEETKNDDQSMFTVLNRLGYPIEILVNGDIIPELHYGSLENRDSSSDKIAYNDGQFVVTTPSVGVSSVSFDLVNSGNVLQEAEYKITLQSFSHQETILTGTVSVLPGDAAYVSENIDFPWWDIPLKVKIETEYTPVFDFESEAITDEMRNTQSLPTLQNNSSILLFSDNMKYILYGLIGLVLLFIIFILIKNNKKKINKRDNKNKN